MSVSVTLKLSPEQFDNVRRAVTECRDRAHAFAKDEKKPAKERHAARQEAMTFNNLLENLNR